MASDALIVSDTSHVLTIGQEFPDVESCRKKLKDIAIALHFDLRIVKSDRTRLIAKCSKEGCQWRVHVAKLTGLPTFTIRTLHGEHTCEEVRSLHHQATVGWVARSVEARIRDNPQYKPKEILQDIRVEHGVAVSYMQAWRGKERSMAALHGTFEEGYRLLPAYCDQIVKANPGSVAYVSANHENCFHRVFVSYSACTHGFISGCRPLLEIDKVHLKGKYLGILLCAAAVDADDALFPIAVAIVDTDTDANWMWFLSELRKVLKVNADSIPRLTILSERRPEVVVAVDTHFPDAYHGFCMRYVSENFRDTFKNPKMLNIFWSGAYALSASEYDSKAAELANITTDVILWFHRFPPHLWAVAYFEGARYGHFSLGITEVLYNWANECHELPIVQTLELVRARVAEWFDTRQNAGSNWDSVLVPTAERRVAEAVGDARCYRVLRANEVEFEIVSSERTNIVDIRRRVCSCRRWQMYGLPCAHAAAALVSCGQDVEMFAEICFRVGSYRETYSQLMNPVADRCLWPETAEVMAVQPPKTRRPPGRPKKKILKVENFKRPKRVVQCGRCRMLGHSQKKCSMVV